MDQKLSVAMDLLNLNSLPHSSQDLRDHYIRCIQSSGLNAALQDAYGVIMSHLENNGPSKKKREKRSPLAAQGNYPDAQIVWEQIRSESLSLGTSLKLLREHFGISEKTFSEKTCLSLHSIQNIEADELLNFSAYTYYRGFVQAILKFFGVEDTEILDECQKLYQKFHALA